MVKKVGVSLKSVVFTDFDKRDPGSSTLLFLMAFLVCIPIAGIFLWDKVPREIPLQLDGHSQISLEIAINRATCGTTSHLVQNNLLRAFLLQEKSAETVPIRDLPELLSGSKDAYCQAVTIPFLNGENSLMLLELVFLKLIPGLSLSTLGLCLEFVRLGCLLIFIVFLMRIGASPFFAGMLFCISLALTTALYPSFYYSGYPFFLPLLLFFISVFGFIVSEGISMNKWLASGLLLILGLCGAFFMNLRSSYSLIVAMLLFVFFIFHGMQIFRLEADGYLKKGALLLLPLFVFLVGFLIFQKGAIDSISEIGMNTKYNYSHHPVAHPLVLGLAVPQNDFAKSEGINWDDSIGLGLAQRVDPEATYLGPTYEKALFSYYIKLWIFHTDEIVAIYQEKFKLAGRSVFDAFWEKRILLQLPLVPNFDPIKVVLWPLKKIKTGLEYLVLFVSLVFGVVTLWLTKRISVGFAYLLISLCGVATLLYFESAIIMPYFYLSYHSSLAFFLFFLCGLFYQGIMNLLIFSLQKFLERYDRSTVT